MKILTTRLSTIILMVFNYQYLHCRCCGKSNNNKTKSTRSTTVTNPPFTPPATHPAKPDGSGDKKIKGVKIPKPGVTPTPYINTKEIKKNTEKEINKASFKGQPKLSVGEDITVTVEDLSGGKHKVQINSNAGYNNLKKTLIESKIMKEDNGIIYNGKKVESLMGTTKTIKEIYNDKTKDIHISFK